jgi:energy-coupling factor transport system permease protein
MILSASLFTSTTPQSGIIKAIEWLLNPFKKLGIPVSEFSLMASLSLRFIPILLEEADRIFNAQRSKGAYLGGFSRRVRALSLSLSPLFTNTFRRAEELTTAMIARGYRP